MKTAPPLTPEEARTLLAMQCRARLSPHSILPPTPAMLKAYSEEKQQNPTQP